MISKESSEISQMYTYITRVFINIGSGSGYEEEDPPMRFRSPVLQSILKLIIACRCVLSAQEDSLHLVIRARRFALAHVSAAIYYWSGWLRR